MADLINDDLCDRLVLGLTESGALNAPLKVELPVDPKPNREIAYLIRGTAQVCGREVTLSVGLTASFPFELPIIFIEPWKELGFLPHIEKDGYVCYASSEESMLDAERPLDILHNALSDAKQVLEDGSAGKNRDDFMEEYESYWRNLPGVEAMKSFLPLDQTLRRISVGIRNAGYSFLCENDNADVTRYFNGSLPAKTTLQNALYIPLKAGAVIYPPAFDEIWSLEDARKHILGNIDEPDARRLRKILKKRHHRSEFVAIHFKSPKGIDQLFGMLFTDVNGAHPLSPDGTCGRIVPIQLERMDKQYLLPRGGGNTSMADKKVILIGCGSVGGHIAMELARSGIGHLTLVDHDELSPDNTYRHALGRSGTEENIRSKTVLLKREIEAKIPYIRISTVNNKIEKALIDEDIDFRDYDLVIAAIGKPQVELLINDRVCGDARMPPALFTWLEPHGIGGHAIVTQNGGTSGCLRCLFDEREDMYCSASFAEKGQSFAKNLTGCSNRFTPFGSINAVRTAALAVELAVNVLIGKERDNPCLSWKGDTTDFLAQNYRLTQRHALTEQALFENRYAYKRENCPTCNESNGQ